MAQDGRDRYRRRGTIWKRRNLKREFHSKRKRQKGRMLSNPPDPKPLPAKTDPNAGGNIRRSRALTNENFVLYFWIAHQCWFGFIEKRGGLGAGCKIPHLGSLVFHDKSLINKKTPWQARSYLLALLIRDCPERNPGQNCSLKTK